MCTCLFHHVKNSVHIHGCWLLHTVSYILSLEQEAKIIPLKNKKDLGMACQTPPLKTAKTEGKVPFPSLSPF